MIKHGKMWLYSDQHCQGTQGTPTIAVPKTELLKKIICEFVVKCSEENILALLKTCKRKKRV
jgi:hypothetical protein